MIKHNHSKIEEDLEKRIIELLADYLGTEAQEIKSDDSLESTLHMTPSDIYEFINTLKLNKFSVNDEGIQQLTSVADLIEAVSSETIVI